MAFSINSFTSKAPGDTITIPFPYLSRDHIFVYVGGERVSTTHYTFSSASVILCGPGFPAGSGYVARQTPAAELPGAQQGAAAFDHVAANRNDLCLLFIAQERKDLEDTVIESAERVAGDAGAVADNAAQVTTQAAQVAADRAVVVAAKEVAETSATIASNAASLAVPAAATATAKAVEAAARAAEAATHAGNLEAAREAFLAFSFLADWGTLEESPGEILDYGNIT